MNKETVTITKDFYDFCMAEFTQIHALCDMADVPRRIDAGDELLSAAQRTCIMTGVYARVMAKFCGKSEVNTH